MRRATAHAKPPNFTSNLAAPGLFLLAGKLVWSIGLCMALGQIARAWLGSHRVLRHGKRLIRPLLVIASILMSLKLLLWT